MFGLAILSGKSISRRCSTSNNYTKMGKNRKLINATLQSQNEHVKRYRDENHPGWTYRHLPEAALLLYIMSHDELVIDIEQDEPMTMVSDDMSVIKIHYQVRLHIGKKWSSINEMMTTLGWNLVDTESSYRKYRNDFIETLNETDRLARIRKLLNLKPPVVDDDDDDDDILLLGKRDRQSSSDDDDDDIPNAQPSKRAHLLDDSHSEQIVPMAEPIASADDEPVVEPKKKWNRYLLSHLMTMRRAAMFGERNTCFKHGAYVREFVGKLPNVDKKSISPLGEMGFVVYYMYSRIDGTPRGRYVVTHEKIKSVEDDFVSVFSDEYEL